MPDDRKSARFTIAICVRAPQGKVKPVSDTGRGDV
jgi:hypothetical protein